MGADCYRIYIICPFSTGFVHSLIIVTLFVLNIDIVIRDRCQNGVAVSDCPLTESHSQTGNCPLTESHSQIGNCPLTESQKLQMVQNCSARLIFKTSKCTHASPLLTELHWLTVAHRIKYKVSSMCYGVVSETVSEAVLKIQFIVLLLCYTTNILIILPLSSLLK